MTQSDSLASDSVLLDYGLRAQARMLPYTLGFFGIGLPIFLWAAKASVSPWLIGLYLLMFCATWPAFLSLRAQAEKRGVTGDDLNGRLWRQALGGGLWVANLLVISLTAAGGGAGADVLLMICGGAAVGIIFFSAPVLLYLLILGPVAVAGPIFTMQALHEEGAAAQLMSGGLVLALAMGFILNRHMRDHYLLQFEALEAAREREDVTAGKVALMETLSREIKTGLSGIDHSLAQGLGLLTRAPAPRQLIETALEEVARLQAILVTTLDNDDAEAGQINVKVEPLDIEILCESVMAEFSGLAHAKELTFTFNAPEGAASGAAMGDLRRVEQILEHLLSNALQYTQQGRVELKLIYLPDGFVRMEVVDSGPGLSDEELDLAFTPHARILRTSSGYSGAGLGLSLSRNLSDLMGGRMGAQSTLDVGSKFWLDLPFDTTAIAPPRPSAPEPETVEEDRFLRVLLLANDSLRAAQLRDQLEFLGHRCLTSTSRERALALAKKGGLDACVISTGAFENLQDDGNHQSLARFLDGLRETQAEARLNIVALLPTGDQAEDLQALGVKPLLLPQNRESLARALAQA